MVKWPSPWSAVELGAGGGLEAGGGVGSCVVSVVSVSVVCDEGDQDDQVVPAHQVDDIDEVHELDPVHQVDHKDEYTGFRI